MIEQGTWPSQEWRLPPKQQDGGSNPPVPAIVFNFSDYSIQSQEFKSDKSHSTRSIAALILDFLILARRQIEYLYKGQFASPHVRSGCLMV